MKSVEWICLYCERDLHDMQMEEMKVVAIFDNDTTFFRRACKKCVEQKEKEQNVKN